MHKETRPHIYLKGLSAYIASIVFFNDYLYAQILDNNKPSLHHEIKSVNKVKEPETSEILKTFDEEGIIKKDRIESRYRHFIEISNNSIVKNKIKLKLAAKLISQGEAKIAESDTVLLKVEEIDDAIDILNKIIDDKKIDNQLNNEAEVKLKSSVLYFLSKAYALNNEHEKSQASLIKLTSKFPQSIHFLESAFRVAEDQFSQKKYSDASNYYKKVVTKKDSKFYMNSMYMLGWSLYKSGDFHLALNQFKAVLDKEWEKKTYSDNILTKTLSKIESDSIRALALSIDRANTGNNLEEVTKPIEGTSYEPIIYKKLASIYESQKRYQDASNVYWLYGKKHPDNKAGFIFATQSNEILKSSGLTAVYIQDEEKLTSRYGKESQYFKKLSEEEKAQAANILEVKSLSIAEYHYKNALKTKKYDSAIFWHTEFIKHNPTSNHLGQILYALGDMYEKTNMPKKAYDAYFKLAYETSSESGASAAYSAFLISKKIAESTTNYSLPDLDFLAQKIDSKEPITPEYNKNHDWHFRYILNAYFLSNRYTNHKHSINALMHASQFSAKKNIWNMASSLSSYAKTLDKVSNDNLSSTQFTIFLAQSNFNKKDYKEAIENYSSAKQQYYDLKKVNQNKIDGKLIDQQLILSKYLLLTAPSTEYNIDKHQKDALINELATQNQNQEIKRKSYLKLIDGHLSNNELSLAQEAKSKFQANFPNDEMLIPLSAQLAIKYESKKDWDNASDQLRYIYENSKSDIEKREANWNIAQWQENKGDLQKAVFWYKKYAHSYKKPVLENIEAQNSLQSLYKKMSENEKKYIPKREFWLKRIVSTYQSNKELNNPRIKTLAAKSTVALADYDFERFINKKITNPVEKSFSIKNRLMKKAISNYQKAISFDIADVTSHSYFQLAEMYGNLAKAMIDAPVPSGLSDLEKEEYAILLEEQAYPFEEKSISIHEQNSQLSFNGIYNQSVEGSFKKLSALLPVRYNKNEIELDYIDANLK